MKTNNKKKIVVSVLALAMGAGLAGSISGSVAWYQYSTRTSAGLVGTSAGTSRNLEISSDGGTTWKQHIDLGTEKFRPASVYGTAGSLNFVEHPVYKTALLPSAVSVENEESVFKAEYSFIFRCKDTKGSGTSYSAKEVYLTSLNIATVVENPAKDITPAVRIEINGAGDNDFIVAATAGTTATMGNLNLNGNTNKDTGAPILDRDGYDADDINGSLITYRNAAGTVGEGYTAVAPSSVIVDATSAYEFTGKTGKLLATTKNSATAENANSEVVKITVWLEGWQELANSSMWDTAWMEQNFKIEMQFACEADRVQINPVTP